MSDPTPHGIRAFDLHAPGRPLLPTVEPLRRPPTRAELGAAERARSQQAAQSYSVAAADWNDVRANADGNPVAVAVLRLHQPQTGYRRAECSECQTDENYEATPAPWPCGTFAAVKAALVTQGGAE